MLQSTIRARNAMPSTAAVPDFNSVISDYLPVAEATVTPTIPRAPPKAKAEEFLDGLY